MKVSLIVPVFNEEKYLPKLFDSICKQSVMPDEIVICDNNSTDKSKEVIKSYQEKLPIKYIFEPRKGIINTVHAAYVNSNGDIVARCDADCILPKDWVKNICKHFEEDDSLDALGGKYEYYDAGWQKILPDLAFLVSDVLHGLILGRQFMVGGNCAFRRKVMDKIGGYNWAGEGVDDIVLYKKLRRGGYRFRRYRDCYNFSSWRRYGENPVEILKTPLSFFYMKMYEEKRT